MPPTRDLGRTLDECAIGHVHLLVLALCFLILIIDGYDAQSAAYVAPYIAAAWGVSPTSLGPAFSAGFFGLAIGSMLFGTLADRWGRKAAIILCLSVFGVLNIAKAFAASVPVLVLLQFVAGLGVGGAMPNTIALVSEYAPARRRALFVTIAAAGYALGTAGAGVVAAQASALGGWQVTFVTGGLAALVLVPVIAGLLPDSARFMALADPSSAKLRSILRRLDPTLTADIPLAIATRAQQPIGTNLASLFREGRAAATLLLWLAIFLDLLVIYYMASWLVVTLHTAGGMAVHDAALMSSLFSLAGLFGTPVVGQSMDRFGQARTLGLCFVLASLCIASSGPLITYPLAFTGLIFAAGFFIIGAHLGINALASSLYPTTMRATGVGWALGVGRMTSSISPLLGGALLARHLGLTPLFAVVAAPAFLAALCIVLAGRLAARGRAINTAKSASHVQSNSGRTLKV